MIISICNQKGGIGKSTLTFNLSYLLADQGKKVLCVDYDPQGSLTTIFSPGNVELNIYDALMNNEIVDEAIINIEKNLDLMVGGIKLANFDLEVASMKGKENILKRLLDKIKDRYDYIILDCPPSLGLLFINALNSADSIIIPTESDYLSYKSFELLLDTIAKVKVNMNFKLKILGIVVTKHDNRTLHNKEILEIIENEFTVLGIIPISTKVKDATLAGLPVHRFDKKHKVSLEYKKIALEVLKHGE